MRRFLTVFIVFIFFLSSHGQFCYPTRQDASDFMKRTLLVQLLEEDPFVLKDLERRYTDKAEKEQKVAQYRNLIAIQNNWIRAIVGKYWKANPRVEFKTKAELEETLKDIKTLRNYGVLNIGWRKDYKYKNNEGTPIEVFSFVAYVAEATDRHQLDLKRGPMQRMDYIFKIAFPTDALKYSDFLFAVQQFNFHISTASSIGQQLERYRTLIYIPPFNKAGYNVVKQKTLMIPEECIPEEKKEEVKAVYDYPFQLASSMFYEEAIEHHFAKHSYVTLAWSDRQNNFAYYIVNASEGIILAELGHKPDSVNFNRYIPETHESFKPYKSTIGFSTHNLVQLKHLLESKR